MSRQLPPIDDDLVQRLPLPLAQLYRRAHNAKSAQERHHAAYYLWEAALKLLGSAAVVSFLQTGRPPDARLTQELQNLARPSVGHWWGLVRALTIELADRDADFARLKDLLLGKARDDLPRVAGLDAALLKVLERREGGRSTVRFTELFDRLVRYRNQEIGHGAVGQRESRHYEEMGRALLSGVPQLLERLDVLAGRRLVYLADVRRLGSGAWLVERYELTGEAPRRLESLERTHVEAAALLPQQVYLSGAALPLRPLVAYDFEANEFLFLNARRGKQRVEYLCYTSGRPVDRVESAAQNALLAQLLDMPVDDARREEWQARSHAEDTVVAEERPDEARRTLGEFELLSELGRGGMGVVYRAWQPSLGRQVALKSLLKTGDAKSEKRFAREIAALGHVEHPHLVRIFTSSSEGDRWFYAMELVEGTTLATVCDRLSASGSSAGEVDLATWRQAVSTACEESRRSEKRLSDADQDIAVETAATPQHNPEKAAEATARTGRAYVRHVVELMRQTAEAAHALHEKGIIHRDIKPGNIMVGSDGASATLMDLGLAQVADETEGRLTRTRQFVGTLRYASPEQVLAVARLDRRSDVYSLGATLWELLALRPLFGATDQTPPPELMQKIQIEEPGRVRRHNPEVPRDLAAVVDKCLQKDPKKRYATAAELAEELSAFLAGKPVKARPVTGAERLWKWAKRRPTQAALLVMTFLTLVSLAVGGTLFAWQAEQERVEAESHARVQERLRREADAKRAEANRHRQEAEKQKGIADREKDRADKRARELKEALGRAEKAEKESREEAEQTRQQLANTSVLLADRELGAGNIARARELLDGVPRGLRYWEWGYLRRKLQGSYCTLYGHTSYVNSVSFSPDGRRLASASNDETVKVWDAVTGKELLTLKGHVGSVTSVVFSPDGQRLASTSGDHSVKVWDAATGAELLTLKGHTKYVNSVSFSPDGRRLASASLDHSVKVWDAVTGKEVHTFDGLTSVTFSPDGRRFATASEDHSVGIWDAATGKEVLTLKGHASSVTNVVFSPDGRLLASVSEDHSVKVWDAATGAEVIIFIKGYSSHVTSVAFSPDGRWLASASDDQTVKVWDAATGVELLTLKGHVGSVTSMAFSPDGQRLASASYDRTVKVWDIAKGAEALTLTGHTSYVNSVSFSPDGRRLASASDDETVKVWDAVTGKELLTLKGHTKYVNSVSFSPDGRRLASASWDKTVKVWDADTGKEVHTFDGLTSVTFSPDGRRFATASEDHSVRIWDAATGKEVLTLKGHASSVTNVVFSPDGRLLASVSVDQAVKVWDATTGKELLTLKGHTKYVTSVAFTPDGRRLASASDDQTVKVWDAATGEELLTLEGHSRTVTSVAFTPDGRRLASASGDHSVKVWDAATGVELLALKGHSSGVSCVAFSPDGRRLASASWDKTVKVWNADTGKKVLTLKGHTNRVNGVVFSPDGRRLASASWGNTVKVWDADTGKELLTLEGHAAGPVTSVTFSPDGRLLASASWDKTVKVWDADTGKELLTLKEHAGSVTSVTFSSDGKVLWGKDPNGMIKAWNLSSGKEIPNPGISPPFAKSAARHPSAPLMALPERFNILIIDVSPPHAEELAFRQAKARFDPFWHEVQASDAEKNDKWFAAAFHRSLLAEHAPWDTAAWEKMEHACAVFGDDRAALAVCDRLLQRNPSLAPVYLHRSTLRMREKNQRRGWADFLRAVHLSLGDHPDWTKFADSETKQGAKAANEEKWSKAVQHYTIASAWKPHDPETLHRLAWSTLAAGDEERYRSVCRRLHARFGNLEGRRGLLTLSVMLGQHVQPLTPARLVIDRAVQQDAAERADAIAYTACLLPDSGIDPQTLVALAARETAIDPSSWSYCETFGAALYRAGKYKEAVEQLEKAVQLQGEGGSNWQRLFLAMSHHRLGNAAKAREWLGKAKLEEEASWESRLCFERLRQEATTLLSADAKPAP